MELKLKFRSGLSLLAGSHNFRKLFWGWNPTSHALVNFLKLLIAIGLLDFCNCAAAGIDRHPSSGTTGHKIGHELIGEGLSRSISLGLRRWRDAS
jgi:hypothetical protein